ncbi:MAG: ABC transporter permease [Epsilonproteobacteria bacterium]|nr:ABC transporter permease [Campylobacterota bacterium]|tara:strand:- start:2312 stop:3094 length:783 start_codon:yes stop_codon:yes gene_type:complete
MLIKFINTVGASAIRICDRFGEYGQFVAKIFAVMFSQRLDVKKLFTQMERIGVDSLPICALIGIFSGAVLTLQTYYGFAKFGSEDKIGLVVALALTRELGPVLTGIMVTGRSGSSVAAEIGTMRITEQVDALETLCIDVFRYLMVPRVLAGILILPFVTMFTITSGIWGGYLVYKYYHNLNAVEFIDGIKETLVLSDITGGLIKGSVFGFILTSIGSYCGYYTRGGAKGVGLSTIQSVVLSSITILVSNYFLAMLLFEKT